jgi:hypothetical protein
MKARDGRGFKTGRTAMTQLITPAELAHMTEQELRALHANILADLRRTGQSAFLSPLLLETLRNINGAILRLQCPRAPAPKPPRP